MTNIQSLLQINMFVDSFQKALRRTKAEDIKEETVKQYNLHEWWTARWMRRPNFTLTQPKSPTQETLRRGCVKTVSGGFNEALSSSGRAEYIPSNHILEGHRKILTYSFPNWQMLKTTAWRLDDCNEASVFTVNYKYLGVLHRSWCCLKRDSSSLVT